MKNVSTKSISKIGILSALVIILSLSPLGFIPIGAIRVTTVHIPIIIIALIEGPLVSLFVGMIFGLFSFCQHLLGVSSLSFMFINPFVSVLPRAMIGIVSYFSYQFMKKYTDNIFTVIVPSILGTLVNTFGVLFFAYIFCANQIYDVLKINPAKFLIGIALSNGVAEIIASALLVPLIVKKILKKQIPQD